MNDHPECEVRQNDKPVWVYAEGIYDLLTSAMPVLLSKPRNYLQIPISLLGVAMMKPLLSTRVQLLWLRPNAMSIFAIASELIKLSQMCHG